MFQIFSKLPAIKNCAFLSELLGTEFEGFVVQMEQLGVPCVKRGEELYYFD